MWVRTHKVGSKEKERYRRPSCSAYSRRCIGDLCFSFFSVHTSIALCTFVRNYIRREGTRMIKGPFGQQGSRFSFQLMALATGVDDNHEKSLCSNVYRVVALLRCVCTVAVEHTVHGFLLFDSQPFITNKSNWRTQPLGDIMDTVA